jgi:hypothetical protein
MGEAHVSTLRRPSLSPVKERVEDPVIEKQDKTKVRVIMPEANVQTPEVATTARGKATYASVLRQPGHACANTAVKWKSEFTD